MSEFMTHVRSEMLAILRRNGLDDSEGMCEYLTNAGGKGLRARLCRTAGQQLGAQRQALTSYAALVELLHAASLLHDDVIDNARQRRGQPAAHRTWGVPRVVLLGDVIVAVVMQELAERTDRATHVYACRCLKEISVQELQQQSQRSCVPISVEAYRVIAAGKTGALFGLSAWLGARSAQAGLDACREVGEISCRLGMVYQFIDDLCDVASSRSSTGKDAGADRKHALLTFPVALYAERVAPHRTHVSIVELWRELNEKPILKETVAEGVGKIHAELRQIADDWRALLGQTLPMVDEFMDIARRRIIQRV